MLQTGSMRADNGAMPKSKNEKIRAGENSANRSSSAKQIIIDAENKSLGRVASQAAKILMGKTSPSYVPNRDTAPKVNVVNAKKLSISERKRIGKKYTRYSGYPGGIKSETIGELTARRGVAEAVRRAVERMLPRNSLRKSRMKTLTITS